MKHLYSVTFFAYFFLISFGLFSQNEQKHYQVTRIEQAPKIDGVLDDKCWENLPIANDFIQYEPLNGKTASERTEVKVTYDNKALYVYAMMYDRRPDSIMTELSERDNADGNTEVFAFTVSPFNDGINAFSFWVTADGVQADFKSTNDQMDKNWNAVWESAVQMHENGWTAEVKIPYSAIRFPKTEIQTWSINFWRSIRRHKEWSTWNFIDKNLESVVPQSGILDGIKDIKPPLRLSVSPYASVYFENDSKLNKNGYSINGGLDLKYGINESFTLDMTLIPDFGQVQSDDLVLNLSPYETYYDEKRSFFTEGTELFDKCEIFYSRRIGAEPRRYEDIRRNYDEENIISNPSKTTLINATKISGRTNKGLGVGFFNAMSSASEASIKDTLGNEHKISTQAFTNYNMIVLDQTLKNNSYVSFVNTNVSRYDDDYNANVTGTEFGLLNKKNSYGISGKAVVSQKYILDSVDLGYNYDIAFKKLSGNFTFELFRSVISKSYDPNDLGYLERRNISENELNLKYKIFEPFWKILRGNASLDLSQTSLYEPNQFLGVNMHLNSQILFKNHTTAFFNANTTIMEEKDYFESRDGSLYIQPANHFVSLFISPDYRKKFLVDLGFSYNFSNSFHNQKAISNYDYTIAPRFLLSKKMTLVYKFKYDETLLGYGYVKHDDALNATIFGEREVRTITNTISTAYIFNNVSSLNFRLRHYWSTAQYSDFFELNADGYLEDIDYAEQHDINFNAFTIDMAYKWQFLPGSEMSLVWKNNIYTNGSEIVSSFGKNFRNTLDSPQINSISLKILYYLDYQYLKKG